MNGSDDDRVQDFFAAHRSRIVDHTPDEGTWETITTRARAARGRSRGLWFLGGAVAASAAAVGVMVLQGVGDPGAQPLPPAGPAPTADGAPGVDGPGTTDPAVPPVDAEADDEAGGTADGSGATDDGSAGPEPADPGRFALPAPDLSVPLLLAEEPTGSEGALRTAVTAVACPMTTGTGQGETFCPELAVSEDEGRTWERRVDLTAAGFHNAVSARGSTWLWPDAHDWRDAPVQPVSRLVRSDDGGRTWTAIPTRGETVLAVETFRSTLVVVTGGCDGGTADSCAEIVVTDVTTDDAGAGRRTARVDLPESYVDVPGLVESDHRLMATYDAIYLEVAGRGTYRLADGEEVVTRVDPAGCRVSAAPDSQDGLVAVCMADVGPVSVHRSADGGATWTEVAPPEGLSGTSSVVSNDGTRLVAATAEGIWVTADDGDRWEQTLDWAGLGGPEAADTPWIKAVAGQEMLAGDVLRQHEEGTTKGRWVSTDDGRTWTEQPRVLVPDSLP